MEDFNPVNAKQVEEIQQEAGNACMYESFMEVNIECDQHPRSLSECAVIASRSSSWKSIQKIIDTNDVFPVSSPLRQVHSPSLSW